MVTGEFKSQLSLLLGGVEIKETKKNLNNFHKNVNFKKYKSGRRGWINDVIPFGLWLRSLGAILLPQGWAGEEGNFPNVDALRAAARHQNVLFSVSTHQIPAKNMKINGLFQRGMLLLPVSLGQFGTSSVDLCSTLLLGLSKGGGC